MRAGRPGLGSGVLVIALLVVLIPGGSSLGCPYQLKVSTASQSQLELDLCTELQLSLPSLAQPEPNPAPLPLTLDEGIRKIEGWLAWLSRELRSSSGAGTGAGAGKEGGEGEGEDALGLGAPSSAELAWGLGFSFDLWGFATNPPHEELSLQLGNIASLEARLDFLALLLNFILSELQPNTPQSAPHEPEQPVTLVLNLEDIKLIPGLILKGRSLISLDQELNFYLERITLTATWGMITSEMEVDPEGFVIEQERLGLKFNVGAISISSGLVLGDKGVIQETIRLSATSGELTLVSEATFTVETQEFRIGLSIGDLELTSASVLTPTGLGEQIFELEVEF